MLQFLVAAMVMWWAEAPAPPAQATGVEALGWISGCWARGGGESQTEEHWMKPAGGTMLGMSRTVRGGKTTEYEFLQIRVVNGKVAYVAKPSGQAEATFPVKTMTDSEIVFEDPMHDFPQRIIYRKTAGGVTARIEGTMNGKPQGFDFPFKRCQ